MALIQYYKIKKRTYERVPGVWCGLTEFVRVDSGETVPDLRVFVKGTSEIEVDSKLSTETDSQLAQAPTPNDWMSDDYLATASIIDSVLNLGVPGTVSFRSESLPSVQPEIDALTESQQLRLFAIPNNELNWTISDGLHFDRYLARVEVYEMLNCPSNNVTNAYQNLTKRFLNRSKDYRDQLSNTSPPNVSLEWTD